LAEIITAQKTMAPPDRSQGAAEAAASVEVEEVKGVYGWSQGLRSFTIESQRLRENHGEKKRGVGCAFFFSRIGICLEMF
jgi:hypothetical protein